MKIIIVGAGEVGSYLSDLLSKKNHNVTVIDLNADVIKKYSELQEASFIVGDGHSCELLVQRNISACDYFIAMTSDDKTNILSCSLAKALGAKNTICRIHDKSLVDNNYVNFQMHFGIDHLLNPEGLCAIEIAKTMRNPYRLTVETIARGKIEVNQVEVYKRSKAGGKSIRDLKLNPKVRIGYVLSGEKKYVASADSVLHAGDIVTLFGEEEAIQEARTLFSSKEIIKKQSVALIGGTEISIAIIRLLRNPRFAITVIESDLDLCERISQMFPNIRVINGEATSLRIFEEQGIGDFDFFVACTKNDEINIVACAQAFKLGSKTIQAAINKPDFEAVLESLEDHIGIYSNQHPSSTSQYISTMPSIKPAATISDCG